MNERLDWSCSDLWGITSYFNPQKFHRRLANYRLFRSHLPVPLVTAELSFGTDFDLCEGDAEILLQFRGGDVMWQKERLLNLALEAVPAFCRKIVWLDCDLIVEHKDWAGELCLALDKFPLVQPYSRMEHLTRDASVNGERTAEHIDFGRPSVAAAIASGRAPIECLKRNDEVQNRSATGMAWAARRDLLERHGFYDACIIGGGDHAMACAAYECYDQVRSRQHLNERQLDHYVAWANPFFDDVRGQVSHLQFTLHHLWHGALSDRRYRERFEGLAPFQFDPFRDVIVAPGGVWRWHSAKPQLHNYVKAHFAHRREDG